MPLGIVYVLTNPAMPHLVKIGRTSYEDAAQRLNQLYSVGVPFPFQLEFACKVPNPDEVEKALHEAFAPQRVNLRREFFSIAPSQAIAILKLLHTEDATVEVEALPSNATPEEVAAGEEYELAGEVSALKERSQRRPNLNFAEMGIPIGAELRFTEGDVTVTVVDTRRVRYQGQDLYLSKVTRALLNLPYSPAPTPYWTYNGNSLGDLYQKTYPAG